MRGTITLVLLTALGAHAATAQDDPTAGATAGRSDTRSYYAAVSLGTSTMGPMLAGELGTVRGGLGWSVRGTRAEEVLSPLDRIWDLGLLRVVRYEGEQVTASAGAGLAVTGGVRPGEIVGYRDSWWFGKTPIYAEDAFTTVGVPARAGLWWTPASWLGVGGDLVGNLNLERPFGGVALVVSVVRGQSPRGR